MARFVNVAAGQLGPVARSETRTEVVARLMALMRQAHANGCDLIVYPELALTTFFPRWYMADQAEIDFFFERNYPQAAEIRRIYDRLTDTPQPKEAIAARVGMRNDEQNISLHRTHSWF